MENTDLSTILNLLNTTTDFLHQNGEWIALYALLDNIFTFAPWPKINSNIQAVIKILEAVLGILKNIQAATNKDLESN